ncbi:uncharacterized protein EURHEDRAFT_529937 [Aspergillus ruber CBS 135680]|uniref:Aminoglycoside phosphotransferase domain-containing protein n=1 Tax=Aspergillus ruber (strain CBS 135680) TaxID=1388766 RepID=A0A017SIQ1_ASPRC|nr:uncharacterized protein EURHEDRAFT_529937 [Aspergillus ruber CBS 135680]EYE96524.1 hypothetical protein EURHEDRAFT_529937 [Aspergillus ruber CBS 135680]
MQYPLSSTTPPVPPYTRKVLSFHLGNRASIEEAAAIKMARDAGGAWLEELKQCVNVMYKWPPPDEYFICSLIGTAIRIPRVPHHIMASSRGLTTRAEFEKTLLEANKLRQRSHRLTLTHGDFRAHNIIVGDDGHLSGFFLFRNGNQCLEELVSDRALNSLTVNSYITFCPG